MPSPKNDLTLDAKFQEELRNKTQAQRDYHYAHVDSRKRNILRDRDDVKKDEWGILFNFAEGTISWRESNKLENKQYKHRVTSDHFIRASFRFLGRCGKHYPVMYLEEYEWGNGKDCARCGKQGLNALTRGKFGLCLKCHRQMWEEDVGLAPKHDAERWELGL